MSSEIPVMQTSYKSTAGNLRTNDQTRLHPLVSIVLPCYNSERYLEQTLASVLAQTYSHWELIAVDDSSSDRTAAMLANAADKDPRIRPIFRRERGGRPAVTKNTGLQHVRGEFVAFIDHDDLFLPEKIEASVRVLQEQADCVAVFHDLEFIDAAGTPSSRYLPDLLRDAQHHWSAAAPDLYLSDDRFWAFQMLRYAGFHTITTLIARHRIPKEQLRFDTSYMVCDDTDLWIRLGKAGRVAYLDRVLAQYRIHGNNITSNSHKVHKDITTLIAHNLRERSVGLTSEEMLRLRRRLSSAYLDLAWSLRVDGAGADAARACWRAFLLTPRTAILLAVFKSFIRPRQQG